MDQNNPDVTQDTKIGLKIVQDTSKRAPRWWTGRPRMRQDSQGSSQDSQAPQRMTRDGARASQVHPKAGGSQPGAVSIQSQARAASSQGQLGAAKDGHPEVASRQAQPGAADSQEPAVRSRQEQPAFLVQASGVRQILPSMQPKACLRLIWVLESFTIG